MPTINFRVSSGLKNIIGKELITDEFVAIFELVKNSFDAYASRIDLYFDRDTIYIIDNGKGMSKEDILNKWLFVAYSAKADNTEDDDLDLGYRKNIRQNKRAFAGNKGVGRFSCDSLGERLVLQSRSTLNGSVSEISVDWSRFEQNIKQEFASVPVEYAEVFDFDIPKEVDDLILTSGTLLKISKLRTDSGWTREKLLKLRPAVAKLVDPFGARSDLDIFIHAPAELEQDKNNNNLTLFPEDIDSPYIESVNGKVKNFIFEKLSDKTTKIKTWIDGSEYIYTELTDRGKRVYLVKEKNSYIDLDGVSMNVELYYMNTKAKQNFSRLMGIPVINFGSVFLFNNGFRVYPVGEPFDDSLGLNTRKTQGYARFLGTRELLGKIYLEGSNEKFKESTSRDQGLIKTSAYGAVKEFFMEKSLKRLEAYVVGVSWPDKLDQETEDLSRILTDQGKSRVVSVVTKLVSGKEIELLDYSEELIGLVNERSESFEQTLGQLQALAVKSGDVKLQEKIDRSLDRFNELKDAEETSRKIAENERLSRKKAEEKAKELEKNKQSLATELIVVEKAYAEEKKRNLFLVGLTSRDFDSIVNFHHQIGIYSSAINHLIQLNIDRLNHDKILTKEDAFHLLENISLKNQQVLAISRFATKANFRMEAEEIDDDLVLFSEQYLVEVASKYIDIGASWITNNTKWPTRFKPIELSIVIDNLLNNAYKARASKIEFNCYLTEKNRLNIDVIDDGVGLPKSIDKYERIFERGVSTTDGSGLGLYHVKQIINDMGGSIDVDPSYVDGAKFKIRFAK